MSLYLLLLSFLPCADGQDTHKDCHDSVSIALEAEIHGDSQQADVCSPFCACACCGATTSFASFQVFQSNNFLLEKVVYLYISTDSHQHLSSIYRPPASLLG